MIDLTRPIALVDYPHLYLYPDLEDTAHYYCFAQPHLALTAEATPDITLITYQKRGVTTGGQLNLTTSLEVSADEQQAVTASLAKDRAIATRLSYPDWIGGQVTVDITDGPTLTGKPSLLGHNQCALSTSLSAEQAQAARKLWSSREDWLTLHYTLQFVGWDVTETQTTQTSRQPGCSIEQSRSVRQTTARDINRQLTTSLTPVNGKHVDIKLG